MYHENIACHVIFEFQWMEMKKWMEVIFLLYDFLCHSTGRDGNKFVEIKSGE